MIGQVILFLWWIIGLMGMILVTWYRYKTWGYSVTLGIIASCIVFASGGPFIWAGLVMYALIEIIDWNKPIIRGSRYDEYAKKDR